MAGKQYVRITPYDKRAGALAERVTLGGRVFEAGQWYTLNDAWCKKIAPLKQDAGAPYFQIMDEATFHLTAQQETLAAMRAQGISGLAAHGAIPGMPTVQKQKTGPKESSFAGMDKEADEVSLVEQPSAPIAPPPEPEVEPLPEVAERTGNPPADEDDDGWPDDDDE
jgi:hypothetical protein